MQETTEKLRYTDYLKVLISGTLRTTASLSPEDVLKFSFIHPGLQLALKLKDTLDKELEQIQQLQKPN